MDLGLQIYSQRAGASWQWREPRTPCDKETCAASQWGRRLQTWEWEGFWKWLVIVSWDGFNVKLFGQAVNCKPENDLFEWKDFWQWLVEMGWVDKPARLTIRVLCFLFLIVKSEVKKQIGRRWCCLKKVAALDRPQWRKEPPVKQNAGAELKEQYCVTVALLCHGLF